MEDFKKELIFELSFEAIKVLRMGMIRVCGKSTDAAVCVGKKAGIGVLKRKGAVERLKHVVTAMLYSKEVM